MRRIGGLPGYPTRQTEARMRTLAEQMSVYQRYHRSGKNKLTHFIGVPVIVLAVLQAFSWLKFGSSGLSAAQIGVVLLLVYYFLLDVPLALASAVLFAVLLGVAQWLANTLDPLSNGVVFAALFVGGWVLQLVGHYFEGKKPALADNLFQIFIAPIFLVAEAAFHLGYKPSLQREIETLASRPV
jgi:uncharacterized membrane protein YGL010W